MGEPGLIALLIPSPGERLDRAILRTLREQAPSMTRARLKGWFEAERVHYQGRVVQPSHSLSPGTHEVLIRGWNEKDLRVPRAQPSRQGSFLPVLFENEEVLILHKLSGVASLPHDDNETETAVSAALAHFPALEQVGSHALEPGLLHRLDTGTSGCLAFAKTQKSFDSLRSAWKTRRVRKFYRALVLSQSGSPVLPKKQSVTTPIAASEKSSKRMIALAPGRKLSHRGKPLPAVTHLLGARQAGPGGWMDLELEIETGVRHQIRCHLASLGLPILGDPIYGPSAANEKRLWLHAWRLELPLANGASLQVEAKLPDDWPA